MLKNKAHLLTALPPVYKAHSGFINAVISFFHEEINAALKTNKQENIHLLMHYLLSVLDYKWDYFDVLAEALPQHELIQTLLTEQKQRALENKQHIIVSLSTTSAVHLSQLMQLTRNLSPYDLEHILLNRNALLPKLPFCTHLPLFQAFCQELRSVGDWRGYLNNKQKLIRPDSATSAFKYLLETDHWFLAYMRYHHHHAYFDNWYDLGIHAQQIRLSFNRFYAPIYIFLSLSGFVSMLVFLCMKVANNDFQLAETRVSCLNAFSYDRNQTILVEAIDRCSQILTRAGDSNQNFVPCLKTLTSKTTSMAPFNFDGLTQCFKTSEKKEDYLLFSCLALTLFLGLSPAFAELYFPVLFPSNKLNFWNEITRFNQRLWGSMGNATFSIAIADNLLTRCEDSIIRLQGLDNHSAQQKAGLLQRVFTEVKQNIGDGPLPSEQIAQKLKEKISIEYNKKSYQLSFWNIAAQKRHTEQFTLSDTSSSAAATTTTKLLAAAPFTSLFTRQAQREQNDQERYLLV